MHGLEQDFSAMKFYGYKKCSTSRKAEKYLEAKGIKYDFIDITEKPPSASALKGAARAADIDAKKMFNTSGQQYREQGIKEKLPKLTDADIFKMLAGNGRLIKRPVVIDGDKATVGFSEESYNKTWK
ncbi:MAG: Spx/MgsR family RNA polymerase-binding regulatory protein [Leptospiraceae bacterium]|nr:Spx/MgsR family RNA polymerase-binding regulatory protein [Leptospiraceae bacterium]